MFKSDDYHYQWVSKPLRISECYRSFKEILSPILPNIHYSQTTDKTSAQANHMQMIRAKLTQVQFQQLNADCDPQLLDIPDEPQSIDVKSVKTKRGLFDGSRAPKDVTLATLHHLKEKDIEKESPAYLKYNSTIWVDHDEEQDKGQKDLNPSDDVLLIIRVYEPFRYNHGSQPNKPLTCSHEIAVLGRQTLDELRDKIACASEFAVEGDVSENPNSVPAKSAKEIYKSGFFFIENTFYNDFRHKDNIDYSTVIREWAKKKKIGTFDTAVMEKSKFFDLTIRFGFPYVYQHLGQCEHLIVFSDARLLHPCDSLCSYDYPRILTVSGRKAKYCLVCKFYTARWVTLDNTRVPHDPCYFCDICFKAFNYKDGEKIGSFRAYRYKDRAFAV